MVNPAIVTSHSSKYIEFLLISPESNQIATEIAFIIEPGSYTDDIASFLYIPGQKSFLYLYFTNAIFHNSVLVALLKYISSLS